MVGKARCASDPSAQVGDESHGKGSHGVLTSGSEFGNRSRASATQTELGAIAGFVKANCEDGLRSAYVAIGTLPKGFPGG